MNLQRRTWTVLSTLMILVLSFTPILPGPQGGVPRAAAQARDTGAQLEAGQAGDVPTATPSPADTAPAGDGTMPAASVTITDTASAGDAPAPAAGPGVEPAYPLPAELEGKTEVVEQRTEDSATFDMGDGTFALVEEGQPMHYQGEGGSWQRIDPAFEPVEGGWLNRTNALHTGLASNTSAARISTSADAQTATGAGFEPRAAGLVDASGQERELAHALAADQASPGALSADGRSVAYPGGWSVPGLSDEWRSDYGSAAYALVLAAAPGVDPAAAPAALEIQVTLRLLPGTQLYVDGSPLDPARLPLETRAVLAFADGQGETFLLHPPDAYEQGNPGARISGSYRLLASAEPGAYDLRVRVPWSWLADPERAYPVAVGPVFQVKSGTTMRRAIYNMDKSFRGVWGGPYELGQFSDGVERLLVRFGLPSMPSGTEIVSAIVSLRASSLNYTDRANQATNVELYPLSNMAWTGVNPTDPPYNSGRPQGSKWVACSGNDCNEATWDITALARDWLADRGLLVDDVKNRNKGLLFKIAYEFCFVDLTNPLTHEFWKRIYPEGCGGYHIPYPSDYRPDPVNVNEDLLKDATGGVRLIVYYAGPTLAEGQTITDPTRLTGGISNPSGPEPYWFADHEYRLNGLPSGRWQTLVARGWGSTFTLPPPPPYINYLAGQNQAGQVSLGLADAGGNEVDAGSPNDGSLSYIALSGRKAAGKVYRARVTEPSAETRPDYYDIKLVGETATIAPALNQVAIWPSASSSANFSTADPLALLNIALPGGTRNFRVDVEFNGDNGTLVTAPFAAQMYDYVRGFGGRLFSDADADAIAYEKGGVLNATWEGQGGVVSYGTGRLGSVPAEPRSGNYALALAYKGPQIGFGYEKPPAGLTPNGLNATLEFAYRVHVIACGEGMLASKKGCQRVACPASSFSAENRRDAGGLQLWSQDGWNAAKSSGAATSTANQYAPLIGGPGNAAPHVAAVGGQITYDAGAKKVSVSSETTVYLINCGTALGGSLQGDPLAVFETLLGGTLERIDDAGGAALVQNGPGMRLFRPWDEADRGDLFAEGFKIFPAPGTANGAAVLRRRTGTDLGFNMDWSVTYTGWPSFAYHITRATTVEPPSLASLSIALGDTVDIDVEVKTDNTRIFRAVRARQATITQPPELGGASGPVQVLILAVGIQRPSDPPKGCADASKQDMSCVDLRGLDDTPSHVNRLWQMPDVHIVNPANLVAMRTQGQLHVWSTDHPAAGQAEAPGVAQGAEGISQTFSFDTFGGTVTVQEEPCNKGGSPVLVIRGETQMAMPMIGGGGDAGSYVAAKFKLCSTSLREVSFEFFSPVGIPIGASGLFCTGMQGRVDVYPSYTSLQFGLDFQAGQGGDGGIVKGHGDVTIDTRGYFEFAGGATLLGSVGANGKLWVAWDPLDIGFDMNISYGDWLTGSARAHMWQGQGWQGRYSWLPNNNEKHFAASVSAQVTIEEGAAFSWWFIDIPPWDITFGIEIAFGQFCTNSSCSAYEWGVKGKFSVCGYDVGLYFGFSHGFDFILGNDDHLLIDEYGGAAAAAAGELAAATGTDAAPDATSLTKTFEVSADTVNMLLGFSWQAGTPQIKLYKPGNSEVISNSAHTVAISDTTHTNPTAYGRLIGVKFLQPPTPGVWEARITGLTGQEHLRFAYLANKGAPSLTFGSDATGKFLAPAAFGENATGSYAIRWQVPPNAPDTATISLYGRQYYYFREVWRTEDSFPEFTIVKNLPYKAGSYLWDTRWLASGYYAVRAVVDDGVNDFPEGSTISDDPCAVRDDQPPERAWAANRFPGLVTFSSLTVFNQPQPAGLLQITDTAAPPAPAGLGLKPLSRGLLATWDPVAADVKDLAGYLVEWGVMTYDMGHWLWVGHLSSERVNATAAPALRIVGLKPKNELGPVFTYGVQVRALDASGNVGAASEIARAIPLDGGLNVPLAPTSPAITHLSSTKVKFAWQPPAQGPAPYGYRVVYRQLASGEWELPEATVVDMVPKPPLPVLPQIYLDGLATGRAYDFRVSSLSSDGWTSAATEPISTTITSGADSNGDGVPDDWVGVYFSGMFFTYWDNDGDGLANKQEYLAGTDPTQQDADRDGFTDGEEVHAGTDPLSSMSFPAQHTQAQVEVDRHTVRFVVKQGAAAPETQAVNFTNAAGGTLSINPAPDKPWIDAWVMTPGELRRILVGVNPAGMSPGYYTGVVRLNRGAGGDPLIGRTQCIRVETWVMPADADVASSLLVVSPHTINVAEGKRGISYNVSLGAAPRLANVTVTPNGNTSQLSVSPASLTFTSANWNVPQRVTVTPVDDKGVEGLHTLVILHTATGAAPWAGANLPGVVVNIADNDVADVYITPASVTVREAGPAAEYSVVLMSQPTADVRVAPSAPAPVGVSPALLTFTPANWNVAQKFRVSAANDGITNGTRTVKISHSVSSNDTNYPTSMDVAVVDVVVNDVPDVSHQFMPLMMHGGRR